LSCESPSRRAPADLLLPSASPQLPFVLGGHRHSELQCLGQPSASPPAITGKGKLARSVHR
ncbi:hypothetical protein EJB05_34367, partial [Eragrostis curvula]